MRDNRESSVAAGLLIAPRSFSTSNSRGFRSIRGGTVYATSLRMNANHLPNLAVLALFVVVLFSVLVWSLRRVDPAAASVIRASIRDSVRRGMPKHEVQC